jgi:hypothetical protein
MKAFLVKRKPEAHDNGSGVVELQYLQVEEITRVDQLDHLISHAFQCNIYTGDRDWILVVFGFAEFGLNGLSPEMKAYDQAHIASAVKHLLPKSGGMLTTIIYSSNRIKDKWWYSNAREDMTRDGGKVRFMHKLGFLCNAGSVIRLMLNDSLHDRHSLKRVEGLILMVPTTIMDPKARAHFLVLSMQELRARHPAWTLTFSPYHYAREDGGDPNTYLVTKQPKRWWQKLLGI